MVIAAGQSQGRGRSGRAWETAPRALAVTAAFDLTTSFSEWHSTSLSLIPLATGLAAASVLGERVALKWPNDLMMNGGKLGGILVEAVGSTLAIGCGINLWWPLPPPERTALFDHDPGSSVGLGVMLAESLWIRLAAGPRDWGAGEYQARCLTIGKRVSWNDDQTGLALDIDRGDGALIVQTDAGEVVRLNAGDVRHLR